MFFLNLIESYQVKHYYASMYLFDILLFCIWQSDILLGIPIAVGKWPVGVISM